MEDYFENIQNEEDDIELADEAMRNTYDFIIGGYDWDNLPEAFWMLEDPESRYVIKQLIEYFTDTEEYEKCAELVKLIKKK